MSIYGLRPTGFVRKSEAQILADIEERQLARISPYLDQSTATPLGQENGIVARDLGLLWEGLEAVDAGRDPDKATGAALESLSKLTGTERRGASFSVTQLTNQLTAGTTLLAGAHFAQVAGDPDNRWTPVADFTAPSTGLHAIPFRAEFAGPVNATLNSINVITTPVTGWTGITASTVPTMGHWIDNDTTLRARREQSLTQTGGGTKKAIRADVLAIPGVLSAIVLANTREYTDADGVPPFSVEVVIWDGATPLVSNTTIAEAIYQSVGTTVPTAGDITVPITEYDGKILDIKFSRVSMLNVYLDVFLTTGVGYVGDTAVKDYIVAQSQAYGVGDDIVALKTRALPLALQGVTDVTSLELGFTANPTGTTNLVVSPRQIAVFDASRITVTAT